MNIEDQVCSLELSKKLKELDITQESYFYHHFYKKNRDDEFIDHIICSEKIDEFDDGKWKLKIYSAFTASELLEILPKYVIDSNREEPFNYFKYQISKFTIYENGEFQEVYLISYICDTYQINQNYNVCFPNILQKTYSENLCNAIANMIIYLIENNLFKVNKK